MKPERYKEEPRKWYWEMRKKKNDISEPHPYCPYLGVQRSVSRLLTEGKKIPWVFREYGVYAEENIHENGYTIGAFWQEKRFHRVKNPTPEDLIELNFYWESRAEIPQTLEAL